MERTIDGLIPDHGGIELCGLNLTDLEIAKEKFANWLSEFGSVALVETAETRAGDQNTVRFHIRRDVANDLAPEGDTSGLCRKLNLHTTENSRDLEAEILMAMLLSPVPFHFPSYEELVSSVRIRRNIVQSARKTSLSFATNEAERPEEYWIYDEDRGFILRPGCSLIDALTAATQPGQNGKRYTFSCRRAGEYIVLLSIAMEVADCHPELCQALHQQAEARALKGREFERIFQHCHGSLEKPLPLKYFVPGDRTWFRNPEPISAEITGYEGSWTFYLGNGIYADFWRPNQHYNLTTKCLSIYHWRNSTFRDAQGELQIDESRVEAQVDETLKSPSATADILRDLVQLQAPLGVIGGGSIEAHRECIRQVCRGTSDLHLPEVPSTNPPE